jgi:hypothetical protein
MVFILPIVFIVDDEYANLSLLKANEALLLSLISPKLGIAQVLRSGDT